MTGPSDPGRYREWQAARRAVARRHHPDRGGDPQVYLARLEQVDRSFGVGAAVGLRQDRWSRWRRAAARYRRRSAAGIRRVRSRLPRGLPGAQRSFEI